MIWKKLAIESTLVQHFKVEITWARHLAGAYALAAQSFDLILLDMTFSASTGSRSQVRKQSLAGIEYLQFLASKGIDVPVIVVTGHDSFQSVSAGSPKSIEELHDLLGAGFSPTYQCTVKVDPLRDDWQEMLVEKVRGVLNGA